MVLDDCGLDVVWGEGGLEMMVEVFGREIGVCFSERFSSEGEEGF